MCVQPPIRVDLPVIVNHVARILNWMGFTVGGSINFPKGAKRRGLPPVAEAKCEISVHFLRFPVENLGLNEYRSSILMQTHNEKIKNCRWGGGSNPRNYPLVHQCCK